ncbi:uncharacterized protein PG998_010989 [Apiospora kogelbergensis]|uniref:Uncharacterized protein n=1 Tax=Apiospora kogelbergensis TaxID=1337665 RepID=A0AAW0RCV8_9PEZI
MSSGSGRNPTKPGSYGIEYWKRDPSPPVTETMQSLHRRDAQDSKQVYKNKAGSSISRYSSRYPTYSSSKKSK